MFLDIFNIFFFFKLLKTKNVGYGIIFCFFCSTVRAANPTAEITTELGGQGKENFKLKKLPVTETSITFLTSEQLDNS